jgi:transcriptional regulator with XRE-family HTH domain
MLITADQIRAARALKNWSQTDLAERTGLAVPTIANIELGKQVPGKNTIEKIIDAFTLGGIEFLEGEGVRKSIETVLTFSGKKDFEQFYELVYQFANTTGGSIYVSNVDERAFDNYVEKEFDLYHMERMEKVKKNIDFKVLVKEGDFYFPASNYASYKWLDEKQYANIPFYVFGEYLGIIFFIEEPTVILIKNKSVADLYRKKFMIQWKSSKEPTENKKKKGRK